jgi:tartrate/fumarate subfamily iron-sulfur-dependent hydro-lyase beta chain
VTASRKPIRTAPPSNWTNPDERPRASRRSPPPLFPLGEDRTTYRKLDCDGVRIERALGREMVVVAADALRQLAEAAFVDIKICSAPATCGSCARSYAGPAKTPEGYASGSFGPTTAGRMDSYVDQFQAAGGSMVMLAKGNRSPAVREACKRHGGFYLGSIGGSAANLAENCIRKVEMLEYPELGMEAIWRIEVENFSAFIVIDDKGNDFFQELNLG